MKNLEINQMEFINGGGNGPARLKHAKCLAEMGAGAVLGGLLGGPVGYFGGMALGYFLSESCH